ncbi:MAG: InlB B-repeat-containing protein, partial [Candidatus Fimimonas sp.]
MNSFDFSENFKLLRRTSDVTQAELSDALGIHPQTVSKWERGVSLPDISKLGELAVALKTSLEKLLALPESDEPVEIVPFDAVRLGEAIAEKRRALGESQQQLAAVVNVSSDAVSRWERGVSCPGIEEFRTLAQHFGCDASQLYYAVENEQALPVLSVAKRKRFFWPFVCVLALLVVAVVSLAVIATIAFSTHTVLVDGKTHNVARTDWFVPVAETKEGYDFLYWQNADGEKVEFPAKITKNCEIFAVYAPTEYAVDYWLNGGEFDQTPNFTITVESGYVKLPKARKNGTEFVGWYLSPDYSGNPVEEISCNLQNVTLYACWQDATYTVKYLLDGGVLAKNNPETVFATESVTLSSPTKKGYVFVGWFDAPQGGNKVESVGGANAKNQVLYAVWQRAEEYFTVTYELFGGEVLGSNPTKVAQGEWYQLASPTKTGYDFVCWNDSPDGNGNVYLNLQNVSRNLTLFAIFKPHVFVVVYEYNGTYATPDDVNPNSVTFGEEVTLNPVFRYGYEFAGWFDAPDGGNKITLLNSQNIVNVSVLYARFTPVICKITCNANGGLFACDDGEKEVWEFSAPYGSSFTLPQPHKDEQTFVGWFDGTDYVTAVNVLKPTDYYLTAHWRASENYYTVTYHLNGGELSQENPQRVNEGEVVALASPTREGFEFLGWFDANDVS